MVATRPEKPSRRRSGANHLDFGRQVDAISTSAARRCLPLQRDVRRWPTSSPDYLAPGALEGTLIAPIIPTTSLEIEFRLNLVRDWGVKVVLDPVGRPLGIFNHRKLGVDFKGVRRTRISARTPLTGT